MNFDHLYERMRRRAPKTLDFDALRARHQQINGGLVSQWRERHPGTDAAVLEIIIPASGHTRRRLRRYRELSAAHRHVPGLLIIRYVTPLDFLDLKTVEIAAAAARADVVLEGWRLLTVAEALAAKP